MGRPSRKIKTARERMASQIEALREKTQERGCTKEEAEAAAMKADELAAKYKKLLGSETDDEDEVEWEAELSIQSAHVERILAAYKRVGNGHIEKILGFIDTGNELIAAKNDRRLSRSSFLEMFADCGGDLTFRRSKGEALMQIARNLVFPMIIGKLPDSWAKLSDLTQIPDEMLKHLADKDHIYPEMTRAEVRKLINRHVGYGADKLAGALRVLVLSMGKMSGDEFADALPMTNPKTDDDLWSHKDLTVLEADSGYIGQIGRRLRERKEAQENSSTTEGKQPLEVCI